MSRHVAVCRLSVERLSSIAASNKEHLVVSDGDPDRLG